MKQDKRRGRWTLLPWVACCPLGTLRRRLVVVLLVLLLLVVVAALLALALLPVVLVLAWVLKVLSNKR